VFIVDRMMSYLRQNLPATKNNVRFFKALVLASGAGNVAFLDMLLL